MESGADKTPEAPAEVAKAAASKPAEPTEEATEETKAEPEAPVESKADSEPEADAAALDPETAKRIAAVSKAEKRSREQLAKERTELSELKASIERERAEIARQLEEVKSFTQLKAKARFAPAEVLRALGLTDDDFEPAARDIYAQSKAAAADPKNREAAARMQAQREYQDKVSQLESKLDAMTKQLEAKEQAAKYEQAWQGFYGDIVKGTEKTDAPLLKTALAKAPQKTQRIIQQVAADIYRDTGEWPDPEDVIVTYEKQRRQELEELGIEYKPATSAASTAAQPGKPSKTVSAASRAPTPPSRKTRSEDRADILAALERGQLD